MSRMRSATRIVVLALAIVALAAAARGFGFGANEASAQGGATVSIASFAFQPAWVQVPVGSTVTWTNLDMAPHTVTSDTGAFDSGAMGTGGSYSLTFGYAGTYTYHCAIHPGMTGTVMVTG